MKILRIRVNGLPLYKEPFDVSFCAVQRVQSNHMNSVYNLFGNIYVNTVEAFAGINASGKTMALKKEPVYASQLMPNVIGMGARDAVYAIESRGVKVKLAGRGKVSSQSLPAGHKIKKGDVCTLQMN